MLLPPSFSGIESIAAAGFSTCATPLPPRSLIDGTHPRSSWLLPRVAPLLLLHRAALLLACYSRNHGKASGMAAGARATPTRTPPRPSSPAPRTEAVVPPDWVSAVTLVSSHSTPPVVVVCGPKNSGKSTFSRILLNALLPRQATTEPNPNPSPWRLRRLC